MAWADALEAQTRPSLYLTPQHSQRHSYIQCREISTFVVEKKCLYSNNTVFYLGLCGVVVSTLDSESGDLGSNPSTTFLQDGKLMLHALLLVPC